MEDQTYILLLFVTIGAVFAALGFPLKRGKIKPNIWYGFRTRKTLSEEKIWYEVNRVTGQDMITAGIAIAAASLVLAALRDRLSPEATVGLLIAVMLIMVGWMAFHGLLILRRM